MSDKKIKISFEQLPLSVKIPVIIWWIGIIIYGIILITGGIMILTGW